MIKIDPKMLRGAFRRGALALDARGRRVGPPPQPEDRERGRRVRRALRGEVGVQLGGRDAVELEARVAAQLEEPRLAVVPALHREQRQ